MTVRALLMLTLIGVIVSSCNQPGKVVAGGAGSPALYQQTPAVPSPPVQLGTYHLLCTDITTNPVGTPPQRFDRYQAINDTTLIDIAAGPSANTITVRGLYLDPRIDDTMLLQDRGNDTWLGRAGTGAATVSVEIDTDAAGAVQQYIVQMVSTSTAGTSISTRRVWTPTLAPIVLSPGLKVARVDSCTKPPPNPGDCFNMIIGVDGLCQWEQDTFLQRYRWNAVRQLNEAQTTTYDTTKNPPNVEHVYFLNRDITTTTTAGHDEIEHAGGALDRHLQMVPSAGWIAPVDASGRWEGKCSMPSGIFQSTPYLLRDQQSDAMFTVDSPGLTVSVTAGGTWNAGTSSMSGGITDDFQIDRLTKDQLLAVRRIDASTYDLFTLIRNVGAPPAFVLTPHTTSSSAMSFTVQRIHSGTLLGAYAVGGATTLRWFP